MPKTMTTTLPLARWPLVVVLIPGIGVIHTVRHSL
jgi:hypothetical protein